MDHSSQRFRYGHARVHAAVAEASYIVMKRIGGVLEQQQRSGKVYLLVPCRQKLLP